MSPCFRSANLSLSIPLENGFGRFHHWGSKKGLMLGFTLERVGTMKRIVNLAGPTGVGTHGTCSTRESCWPSHDS